MLQYTQLLDELVDELVSQRDWHIAALASSEPEVASALLDIARSLQNGTNATQALARLDQLIQTAHTNMASCAGTVQFGWRRFYTEASILRALGGLAFRGDNVTKEAALASVKALDSALIIAAAPGEGRLDLIHELICQIQSAYLKPANPCDRVLGDPSSRPGANDLTPRCSDVPSLSSAPSFLSFQEQWSKTPFVLRRHVSDWPALTDHPWRSVKYLQSVAGPGRIVPVEVGADYRSDDWTQKLLNWDDFLSVLSSRDDQNPHCDGVLYLAQHNLMIQFPQLRDDIIIPDYVYATLPPPHSFPQYKPPGNEEQLVINVWLGPAGAISPAHTDPYFNCYAQVVGTKTVWLAPPEMTESMDPYVTEAGKEGSHPAANHTNPSMSNTSRVEVFPRSKEVEERSREEHPTFWAEASQVALCTVLEPGDLLFFPPGWWHAMRSEDTSFSVSMWF